MRLRPAPIAALCALPFVLVPTSAASQTSAAEMLEAALAHHESRTSGIENYTIVQNVMGMESTIYYERETVNGRTVFRPRHMTVGGQSMPVDNEEAGTPHEMLASAVEHAKLEGTETVQGRTTHVLAIDDLSAVPGLAPLPEEAGDMELRRATLYLDAADHVVRKMMMEGTTTVDGRTQPITMEVQLEDYRDIEGLLHPFRSVMKMTGPAPGMSPADIEQARRSFEEMKAAMAKMSDAERKMMEGMMKPQMERLEKMLSGGGMEFVVEVTDLRVNTGPPGAR
ncbi:MAG TPA: hypothetical protein VK912_04965 [Longimicrobiales bacterium]|nr:hypothetical protein [Longimicrobiales bacterium]